MKISNVLNYVFIIGLVILILNDHLLKEVFGNWWTGKLSDFAGVLILPMFIQYLFPIKTKNAAIITVLFFVFWKSPYSQFIIDGFNSIGLFSINRAVDYTDFLAFAILPLSVFVLNNTDKFKVDFSNNLSQKLATYAVVFVAMIAFTATSMDDDSFVDYTPTYSLWSCCNQDPIDTEVGAGRVYIPTVFTPNFNGANDFFQISTDSNIEKIDTFLVIDWFFSGDTVFNKVDITEIIPTNGFNGVVADTIASTRYYYEIVVTSTDDVQEKFVGHVCCIPCTSPINVIPIQMPDSLGNCAFPMQFDVNTGYDPSIDPEEDIDCFQ